MNLIQYSNYHYNIPNFQIHRQCMFRYHLLVLGTKVHQDRYQDLHNLGDLTHQQNMSMEIYTVCCLKSNILKLKEMKNIP